MDKVWNGLIVVDSAVTHEEEELLAKRGIYRIAPDWQEIFRQIRSQYARLSGEPYEAFASIITWCDCFEFISRLCDMLGLEIGYEHLVVEQVGMAVGIADVSVGDLVFAIDLRLQHFMGTSIDHVGIVSDAKTIIHVQGTNYWEGVFDDFFRRGRFVIGRRIIGCDGIATFALEGRRSAHKGFSLENRAVLRSYL